MTNRIAGHGTAAAAPPARFRFDGAPLEGLAGEPIAAALAAAGIRGFRHTRGGGMRGLFCGMGVCQECLVTVDGVPNLRACMTPLRDGAEIRSQVALPVLDRPGPPADAAPRVPQRCDVLVVGGGPAGLAAAIAARQAGAEVVLLDERSALGGQYFKPLSTAQRFAGRGALDAQFRAGAALVAEARASGARILTGAAVWGAFAPDEIAVEIAGRTRLFAPKRLVLATGAYERAVPFPGWTLPGVMTTGAGQTLVRSWRVAPGRRVLVAGNGPLNLQLANELLRAGVAVVALAEAAPAPGPRHAAALVEMARTGPGLVARGAADLLRLLRAGVPVLHRHVVLRAEGEGALARVVLARLSPEGRPEPGSECRFEADALCVGYGFHPSSELARALGCEQRWDPARRMLVTLRDEDCRTSIPEVFVAGDGGGLGGARVALEQGRLAGWAAAADCGHPPDPRAVSEAREALARHLRFQAALWRLYRAPDLSWHLAEDDTPVCRCEEVPKRAVAEAAAADADPGAAKRATRCGMGRCQGRYCGPLLAAAAAEAAGLPLDESFFLAPRPPAKPLPLSAIARADLA
ncbi:MAG: FAD-dependent oxidoreductase [Acetobacteraceae bacterium]|nr:FAD-dependent oxidoreductase [Acetobacteraceae bacterium]